MAFRIVAGEGSPAGWDLYDDEANTSLKNGSADYQRALCYLAGGDTANALTWLQRSLEKNATEETRAKLVDIHYARKEFAQVAALYQRLPISKQTNEQTMLRIAASLDKLGKTQAAIEALEGSLRFNEPTAPLYLTLASYYQQLGNSAKARELEVKGKLLLPKANTPIS
jgi:tetratricopeptide (TPR) repeat protein